MDKKIVAAALAWRKKWLEWEAVPEVRFDPIRGTKKEWEEHNPKIVVLRAEAERLEKKLNRLLDKALREA